jgi:hypothetical protein
MAPCSLTRISFESTTFLGGWTRVGGEELVLDDLRASLPADGQPLPVRFPLRNRNRKAGRSNSERWLSGVTSGNRPR